jgi:hypothetical protein
VRCYYDWVCAVPLNLYIILLSLLILDNPLTTNAPSDYNGVMLLILGYKYLLTLVKQGGVILLLIINEFPSDFIAFLCHKINY